MRKSAARATVSDYALTAATGIRALDVSYPVIEWLGIRASLEDAGRGDYELIVRCDRVLPYIERRAVLKKREIDEIAEKYRAAAEKRRQEVASMCAPDPYFSRSEAMMKALREMGRVLVLQVLDEAMPRLKKEPWDWDKVA